MLAVLNEYRTEAMLACVTLYFYRLFDIEVFQYWFTAALIFQFEESLFLSWLPVKQGVHLQRLSEWGVQFTQVGNKLCKVGDKS